MLQYDQLLRLFNTIDDSIHNMKAAQERLSAIVDGENGVDSLRQRAYVGLASGSKRTGLVNQIQILFAQLILDPQVSQHIKETTAYKNYENLKHTRGSESLEARLAFLKAEAECFKEVCANLQQLTPFPGSASFIWLFNSSSYYRAALNASKVSELKALEHDRRTEKRMLPVEVDCSAAAVLENANEFCRERSSDGGLKIAKTNYEQAKRRHQENPKDFILKAAFYIAETLYLSEVATRQSQQGQFVRFQWNPFYQGMRADESGLNAAANAHTSNKESLFNSLSNIIQRLTPEHLKGLSQAQKTELGNRLASHSAMLLSHLAGNPQLVTQLLPALQKHGDVLAKLFEVPHDGTDADKQKKHSSLIDFVYKLMSNNYEKKIDVTAVFKALLQMPSVRSALIDLTHVPADNNRLYAQQSLFVSYCLENKALAPFLRADYKTVYDNFQGDLLVHTALANASPSKKTSPGLTDNDLSDLRLLTKESVPAAKLRVRYLTGERGSQSDVFKNRNLFQRRCNANFLCSVFTQEDLDFSQLPLDQADPTQRLNIVATINSNERMATSFSVYLGKEHKKPGFWERVGQFFSRVLPWGNEQRKRDLPAEISTWSTESQVMDDNVANKKFLPDDLSSDIPVEARSGDVGLKLFPKLAKIEDMVSDLRTILTGSKDSEQKRLARNYLNYLFQTTGILQNQELLRTNLEDGGFAGEDLNREIQRNNDLEKIMQPVRPHVSNHIAALVCGTRALPEGWTKVSFREFLLETFNYPHAKRLATWLEQLDIALLFYMAFETADTSNAKQEEFHDAVIQALKKKWLPHIEFSPGQAFTEMETVGLTSRNKAFRKDPSNIAQMRSYMVIQNFVFQFPRAEDEELNTRAAAEEAETKAVMAAARAASAQEAGKPAHEVQNAQVEAREARASADAFKNARTKAEEAKHGIWTELINKLLNPNGMATVKQCFIAILKGENAAVIDKAIYVLACLHTKKPADIGQPISLFDDRNAIFSSCEEMTTFLQALSKSKNVILKQAFMLELDMLNQVNTLLSKEVAADTEDQKTLAKAFIDLFANSDVSESTKDILRKAVVLAPGYNVEMERFVNPPLIDRTAVQQQGISNVLSVTLMSAEKGRRDGIDNMIPVTPGFTTPGLGFNATEVQ